MRVIWAVLATACVTQTWSAAAIAQPARAWAAGFVNHPLWWRRYPAQMVLCPYCVSHWIGAAWCLASGVEWRAWLAVIWLANHATVLYHLVTQLPAVVQIALQTKQAQIRACEAEIARP